MAIAAFLARGAAIVVGGCAAPLTVAEPRDGGALGSPSPDPPPVFGEAGEAADGEGPVVSDPTDATPIEVPLPDGDGSDDGDASDGALDASLND